MGGMLFEGDMGLSGTYKLSPSEKVEVEKSSLALRGRVYFMLHTYVCQVYLYILVEALRALTLNWIF